MEYLKKFNLTDNDLLEISDSLDEMDYLLITTKQEKVEKILKYFVSIGITNIKDIIIYKCYILHDNLEIIQKAIINCNNKDISRLLNDDINNFSLIGY